MHEKDFYHFFENVYKMQPNHEKTAVLCYNDIYALEILEFLLRNNISVPDDIGIMGFDNIDLLKYIHPKLHTVSYPIEDIGTTSFAVLKKLMDGATAEKKNIFKCDIIEGTSL